MACCSEDGACPMHKANSQNSGSTRAISQSDADDCCAGSERNGSTPTVPSFGFSVSLGVTPSPVRIVVLPAALQLDASRVLVPLPGTQVPKHLLLSVFLV
jgi:hypothetical protein